MRILEKDTQGVLAVTNKNNTTELLILKIQDEDIIHALQNNDNSDAAFRQLVAKYKHPLYWHIRHMVKNHDDTDDILQNVFIKTYKGIHQFRGDSKLYSWLYRIATNEAITFLNQKAKKNNISLEQLQQQLIENLEADAYYDGNTIQLKLQQAIATLPQKQQQVFNMKYFQELKYREIAAILQTSEGALKASYHLATKKIEQFLKNH